MTHIYRIVCKRALFIRKVNFDCMHTINKSSVMNVNRKAKKLVLGRSLGANFGAPVGNDDNGGSTHSSKEPWLSNFYFYNNKKINIEKPVESSEYFSNYDALALMGSARFIK